MKSNKTTVSLEDLLRVKRSERPPAEFWNQFEREMRTKQLAAIVEPRPWWAPFIRVGARVSHYQLPVGAAAILALSFVTVREYRTDNAPAFVPEIAAPALHVSPQVELPAVPELTAIAAPVPSAAQLERLDPLNDRESDDAITSTGRVAHTMPLLDQAPIDTEPSPSARAIAANLAAAQAVDPGIVDDVFGYGSRTVELRERPRDPLAQISSPGESRRSRLLGTALPALAGANDVAVGTSDRVARYLTEERLYDTISRIGVSGDRVAIKF